MSLADFWHTVVYRRCRLCLNLRFLIVLTAFQVAGRTCPACHLELAKYYWPAQSTLLKSGAVGRVILTNL
jgi:hypothetical protein